MFKQFLVLLALLAVSNAALRGAEAPEDTIQRSGGTEVGGVPATVSTTPVEKETAGDCGCCDKPTPCPCCKKAEPEFQRPKMVESLTPKAPCDGKLSCLPQQTIKQMADAQCDCCGESKCACCTVHGSPSYDNATHHTVEDSHPIVVKDDGCDCAKPSCPRKCTKQADEVTANEKLHHPIIVDCDCNASTPAPDCKSCQAKPSCDCDKSTPAPDCNSCGKDTFVAPSSFPPHLVAPINSTEGLVDIASPAAKKCGCCR